VHTHTKNAANPLVYTKYVVTRGWLPQRATDASEWAVFYVTTNTV